MWHIGILPVRGKAVAITKKRENFSRHVNCFVFMQMREWRVKKEGSKDQRFLLKLPAQDKRCPQVFCLMKRVQLQIMLHPLPQPAIIKRIIWVCFHYQ